MVSVYPDPNLFFKCWMDPRHWNCPLTMMPGQGMGHTDYTVMEYIGLPSLEQRASHSSIE